MNSFKMVEPSFISLLKKNNKPYRLLEVDLSDEFDNRKITTATWGNGVDAAAMTERTIGIFDTSRYDLPDEEDVISAILSQNIIGDITIVWSNALLYGLILDVNLALEYISDILAEDFDCWIFQENQNWLIEKYHEGEVVYIID